MEPVGAGSGYSHAEYLDGSIVLTDASGATHTWAKTSDGGYAPPVNSDGVLAVDDTGTITVTEGEVVTVFNPDGTLATVSSVLDSKKPAALRYKYSGNPARLSEIEDPVSGRSHTLHYNTDNSNSCYGGATKPPGEVDDAPLGMLCRVTYWDGRETLLWYTYAASLSRIENPGKEVHDFQYVDEAKLITLSKQRGYAVHHYEQEITETRYEYVWVNDHYEWLPVEYTRTEYITMGPMSSLRDPLTYDWLARQTSDPGDKARTIIKYEPFYDSWNWPDRPIYIDGFMEAPPKFLRPQHISTAAADGRNAITGEGRWYDYGFDTAIAKPVQESVISGGGIIISPSLPERRVTFDLAGRELTSIDGDGVTSAVEWTPKDQPIAALDGTGRKTTAVYDHADRLVDTYGPAPADCFQGQVPTEACKNTVPHAHTGYDEGMTGLQAQLYANPALSGIPDIWQTSAGTPDGSLAANWGDTPPVDGSEGWSARFTGEIQFPHAGDYRLGFTLVDGARLWIDDFLLVDSWTDKASTTVAETYTNATAGSWHRLRIDYYNRSGDTGALNFAWMPPGAAEAVTVPGQHLRPRYGLETSKVTDNSNDPNTGRAPSSVVLTDYSDEANGIDPVLGLVTAKINDPGGLQLVRRNHFENPGEGYLRELAHALPAGDITDPAQRGTYTYYGDTETRANLCDPDAAPAVQAGMVKTLTSGQNAEGTAHTAETVYDNAGRIAAVRIDDEPWSCTSFDTRSRPVRQTYPAMGDQPARTITYDYAAGDNPLAVQVTDESGTTTTVVDLLGRTTSYTDANGVVTATTYDPYGRANKVVTTVKGTTSTQTFAWTGASRLARVDLDGTTVATPTYTNGVLTSATYGNGSSVAVGYNAAAALTQLAWTTGGSTVTDTVTRTRDQRVVDDTISDSAGGTFASSYAYDGVGRPIAARVPHHELNYSYAPDGGCGPNPKAGLNSNRTHSTDSFNGGPAEATVYCYGHADRILSTDGALELDFTYDDYGNATTVGTDTLGYDSTRRHVSTTTGDGVALRYTRDVNDRIMMREVQGNNNTSVTTGMTRYGYTSSSGMEFILDGTGALLQRVVSLPGGVVLTKTYNGTQGGTWSYPNIHGDILFTAANNGARTGKLHLYDPFGQNIDPDTGEIGDIAIPETAQGGLDFGYLGQHTVPIEHVAGQQALEMGARTYLPVLGRFPQTDPVLAGSANAYDYANADPVNSLDLTGRNPGGVIGGILGAPLGPAGVAGGVVLGTLALGILVEKGAEATVNYQNNHSDKDTSQAAEPKESREETQDWPTPEPYGNCWECAEEIQENIGGEIYKITDASKGPFLGESKNNPRGDWKEHYAVMKDGRAYDAFTGPEGMPFDEYRAQWKYGEYLRFDPVK